ncbi:MAG: amino acid adenylation domain-containing protein, partial [Acidobacteriota bacterium]
MSQHDALDAQARLLEKLRARKRAAANKGADDATAEPSRPKAIQPVDRSQPLRLSFGQERLWLLDRLAPGGNAFHMAFPLRIRGRLDVEALRRAVHDLVARHEMLRTVFAEIDGEPRQRVLDMAEAPEAAALRMVDLSDLDPAARDARTREIREIREADGVEPFDLSTGPLYRATLIILGDERFELLQTMHHIVSDGWSTGLIFRDLGRLLDAHTRGVEPDLPPITVQYVDVAAHQREQLSGETLDRLVDYWRKTLDGAPQTLALPLDRPRPANSSHRGDGVEATIPSALATELSALARAERTSLFTVLLTAFDLLIARLAGQDDVLVGSPVAGRQTLETEPLVGFFLNTLILRAEVDPKANFRTLLRAVRGQVMSATQHQDVPFEKLLEELQPERHMSLSPFFQVLFNMANLPDLQLRLPGVTVELVTLVPTESKFDLTVYVFEGEMSDSAEALRLIWVYDTELFDRARIEVMVEQYLDMLGQIVADPDRAVDQLDLVTDGSRRRLPDPTMPLDAPWRESVPAAVARHAAATPERIALVDSRTGVTTTYAELHERSRRIARRLAANGIRRGDVVAIWAHRSTPLVDALVGLLDAGAAFTLFDPNYPISRLLDYVDLADPRGLIALDDAGPLPDELVDALTSRCRDEAGDRWLPLGPPGTPLDGSSDDEAWPGIDLGADDLAYVAFTSGSTGKPKAVLGRHGPLLHLIPSFATDFDLGADDRHALLSALAHDPLHRDVFHPLGFGATLAVPDPERIGAPGYLADWLVEEGVTVANLVPAMLQMLCASAHEGTELSQLRRVFTVGEVLTRADVDALYALAPEATCVNLYGATETQRAVGHVVIPRRPELDAKRPGGTGGLAKAALPLGRGVEATQLLVLGPGDRLAGIGEPGEIAVRSPLLARGYTDPEATRERFVTNPFTGRAGDRIYRTGDLGRYLPNGDVEYIGRADSQVKVRGFRIELQEIEVVLASLPTIRESVVVVRDDDASGPYLAAYVVAEDGVAADGTDADPRAWRSAIAERLPDYMVPAAWVVLAALPKTGTGKLDRRALPEPDRQLAAVEHRPPTRPAERQLAEHWKAVLDVEQVGLDDHFFELGGHSLLATRLLARLRDDLGIELPLRAVFDHPQLEAMAAAIATLDPAHAASTVIPRVERDGPLATSFAQRRLWFLDRLETDSAAYVLSAGIRLLGPLDAAHLQRALDQLVERHETLRTRIVTLDDGEPAQLVDPPAPQALPRVDLRSLGPTDALAEARRLAGEETRRPMDLATGPLLRTTLLHLATGDHVLLLSMHHAISDGWSIGIFFRELSALYRASAEGREAGLPSLPLQYADFAAWEGNRLRDESLDHLLDFWREHLAGAPAALELPT